MAKRYYWEIPENETDIETGLETGKIITHKIHLKCSNLTGKILITIDGTKFDISEKPFSLKRVEQMFRLGELAALISFKGKGGPTITVDNVQYKPKY